MGRQTEGGVGDLHWKAYAQESIAAHMMYVVFVVMELAQLLARCSQARSLQSNC